MPGGQYTNLKEQAEAMGLGARWPEIARMYADVNMAFGDIVKVTPSSKVVGDLAIFLVSHDMTVKDLENLPPDHHLTLPNSVIDMFMGSLGEPEGGWPEKIQRVVLRGKTTKSKDVRASGWPRPILKKQAKTVEEQTGSESRTDLMSYLMYPDRIHEIRESPPSVGRHRSAADAPILLRHGERRRDHGGIGTG